MKGLGFVLSPEQREIVEHPLDPLRVEAGAGTGKTTTVVARILDAISSGIAPEQALGITFTNKAAEELADRLRKSLPELTASGREIEVSTYHGFAWRLLQEFGALIGVERDSQVIGPGFVRQLMLECLAGATYEHLDLTAPAFRINEAAQLARQLGDNLLDPDALLDRSSDPVGDIEVAGKRAELAGMVRRYRDLKIALRVLDHGDLISMAHTLTTAHTEIARRIRERYRLVVLDEYQDTDPGQRTLLQTIFGDGFPLMAVGDDSQIIYEWRGASTENFARFPTDFPTDDGEPAATKPLTLNRRSGRNILDLANVVRTRVKPEAAFSPLRPQDDAPDGHVAARYFRTAAAEAAWIAEETARLHEAGTPWREIAVLFRKNAHISLVRDALEAQDVPVEVVSLGGLLDVRHVADLHAWLRLLDRPDDSAALARVLLAGRYRLGLGDLAPLATWVKDRNRATESEEERMGWPLLEAIDDLETVDAVSAETTRRLQEFRNIYRHLLIRAQSLSLVELCREVLDATGAWNEVEALPAAGRLTARLNLYRFLDLAEEWSPLQGRPSLTAFLAYLEVLADEQATDELDTARVGGSDAVALLTVHRAKGLEWEVVFVPTLAESIFPARSLGYDNPLLRPQVVPYRLRIDAEALPVLTGKYKDDNEALAQRHLAQEWRTAYVAVTRARTRLYLSGAYWYTGRKPLDPSELFELAAGTAAVVHRESEAGEPPERPRVSSLAEAPDPVFDGGWKAALRTAATEPGWIDNTGGGVAYDAVMEQYELMLDGLPKTPDAASGEAPPDVSVTGLVTLAQCPKRYYWSEVDPLPRRPAPARRRGIEIHRRIELHHRGQFPIEELEDDLYDMAAGEAGEERIDSAYQVFRESRFAVQRPLFVETPIDIRMGPGRIRGRIDAIYGPAPGEWEIVDFKSGRPSQDRAAAVQLQAYAVAAAEGAVANTRPEAMTVTFAYLGGGQLNEQSENVTDSWLDTARERLAGLMESSRNATFPESPGPACRTCDFLRFCEPGKAHIAAETTL